VEFPALFPVVQMITGTTPRGGGTWKYILHGLEQGLLRRNPPVPMMVQALHFKDYHSIKPKHLERWASYPLRTHYNGKLGIQDYKVNYQGSIFVDSGGFLYMWGEPPGLEAFGFTGPEAPRKIFEFSLKLVNLPGDRVTSLDYPIPPGLSEREARSRLRQTRENALEAARILRERAHPARLVVPVHGRSPEEAARFAKMVWRDLKKEGLLPFVWGLGLGSMVPLRKAHRTPEILAFVRAVRESVPEMPLHVFGVTGLLVPFLLATGAVSFDSAGYVQKARALKYIRPGYKETNLRELVGHYPCSCSVCKTRNLDEDLATLSAADAPSGQKSRVYAAVALHNLEMDFNLFEEAAREQKAGTLEGFLHTLAQTHPRLTPLMAALEGKQTSPPAIQPIPLTNDPKSFDWRRTGWQPKARVLLLIPCSQEKPYIKSRSAKAVLRVIDGLPVDVVFLSGLYGPVPLDFVQDPAVLSYDFLLQKGDLESYLRIRDRLLPLLKLYPHQVAYLAPPAYREVVKELGVTLLPVDNRSRFSHYHHKNLELLRNTLESLCLNGA
jgi:7-cyano-7-deazaguanine tRNA-ribosyltransferase